MPAAYIASVLPPSADALAALEKTARSKNASKAGQASGSPLREKGRDGLWFPEWKAFVDKKYPAKHPRLDPKRDCAAATRYCLNLYGERKPPPVTEQYLREITETILKGDYDFEPVRFDGIELNSFHSDLNPKN